MNPQPKDKNFRSKKYLNWLKEQPPLIWGTGQTVYHHLKCLNSGGIGLKPPDNHCIPISDSVHQELHRYGELNVLDGRYGYNREYLKEAAEKYYKQWLKTV